MCDCTEGYSGREFACFDCAFSRIDDAFLGGLLSAEVEPVEQFKMYNKIIFRLVNEQIIRPIRLGYEHIVRILETVKEIFKSESTLIEIDPDHIHILGDLHGSKYDLVRIYNNFNILHNNQFYTPGHSCSDFVFLGNYIDHGNQSLEVLMVLFCMKIVAHLKDRLPGRPPRRKVIMLRGNHETREMSYSHGFRAELHSKFDKGMAEELFDKFNDVFNHMPLACLIRDNYLCMHGGISPKLTSLDAIRRIPKPLERVDRHELARDLLWADFKEGLEGFEPNDDRGISVRFGEDVLEQTLDRLGLENIFRSHQKVKEGCRKFPINGDTDFMVTITSYSGSSKKNALGMIIMNRNCCHLAALEPEEEPVKAHQSEAMTSSN